MSDDDISELILRASAYLDGELDAAEIARAEADPAVMAEVEAMRSLQAQLAGVDPAGDHVRESAIAAALVEFDRRTAPVAETTPERVVPYRPRPSYARWLTAAAAVVAVGVLGLVAARGLGGDEAGDAAPDARLTAESEQATASREVSAADAVAESAVAELDVAAAEEAAPAAEAAPATEAPAAEVFVASAPASTAPDGAGSPPFDSLRPIADVVELAAVGNELQGRAAAGTLGATVETACDTFPFEPLQAGRYDDAGVVRDVIIAVDPATLQTRAVDAGTCELVAETPLP